MSHQYDFISSDIKEISQTFINILIYVIEHFNDSKWGRPDNTMSLLLGFSPVYSIR